MRLLIVPVSASWARHSVQDSHRRADEPLGQPGSEPGRRSHDDHRFPCDHGRGRSGGESKITRRWTWLHRTSALTTP